MNKRPSLISMSLLSAAALCALLAAPVRLRAVSGDGRYSFERNLRRNFWNDGINAAGLRCDTLSFSNADLSAGYTGGSYRNISDPTDELDVKILARTVTHLKNISLAGHLSFRQREWYNAGCSMLMDEGEYPFNVYEFTPGRKTFQTYSLKGAISVDLTPSWRIGGVVDFDASNAAKKNDLRYTGYLMNLSAAPSFQCHGKGWAAGMALIYKRKVQTVTAEQIGSAKDIPTAFFDEGAMVGNYQEWTGSGSHLKEAGVSGFPTTLNSFGLALQGQVGPFYLDAGLDSYAAFAGEKQTVWYRWEGLSANAHLGWRSAGNSVRASFEWTGADNSRTILDKQTEGGVTTTVEYGAYSIFRRDIWDASLQYEFLGGPWEARASLFFKGRNELGCQMYPYLCKRFTYRTGIVMDGVFHLQNWDFNLGAGLSLGKLTDSLSESVSGTGVTSTVTTFADEKSELYDQYCDYMNRFRYSVDASVRYNFKFGLYLQARAGVLVSRWGCALSVGYNF